MLVHDARVRGKVHENEVGGLSPLAVQAVIAGCLFHVMSCTLAQVQVVSVSQRVERAHGVPLTAAIHPQYVLFGLAQGLFDYGP